MAPTELEMMTTRTRGTRSKNKGETAAVEKPVEVNKRRKAPPGRTNAAGGKKAKKGAASKQVCDGPGEGGDDNSSRSDASQDAALSDGGSDSGDDVDDDLLQPTATGDSTATDNLTGTFVNVDTQQSGQVTDVSTLATSNKEAVATIQRLQEEAIAAKQERDALMDRLKRLEGGKSDRISRNSNARVGRGKNAFLKTLTAHDKQEGGDIFAWLKMQLFPKYKFLFNTPKKKWSTYSELPGTLCKLVMFDRGVKLPTGMDRRTYWHSVVAPYISYSMSNLRSNVLAGVRDQWNGMIQFLMMCVCPRVDTILTELAFRLPLSQHIKPMPTRRRRVTHHLTPRW